MPMTKEAKYPLHGILYIDTYKKMQKENNFYLMYCLCSS